MTSIGFASANVLPSLPEKNNENLNYDSISLIDNKIEYCNINSDQADFSLKNCDSPTCTISCSVTVDSGFGTSLTITTSAGSWFTSCETATLNCNKKLMHKIVDLAFE